jgi:hypothetical protein
VWKGGIFQGARWTVVECGWAISGSHKKAVGKVCLSANEPGMETIGGPPATVQRTMFHAPSQAGPLAMTSFLHQRFLGRCRKGFSNRLGPDDLSRSNPLFMYCYRVLLFSSIAPLFTPVSSELSFSDVCPLSTFSLMPISLIPGSLASWFSPTLACFPLSGQIIPRAWANLRDLTLASCCVVTEARRLSVPIV